MRKVISVADIKKAFAEINKFDYNTGDHNWLTNVEARKSFLIHLEFIAGLKIISTPDPVKSVKPKKYYEELSIMDKGINQRSSTKL